MRVLVLGASGIIGAHMRSAIPPNVEAIFHRRTPTPGFVDLDLTDFPAVHRLIAYFKPWVIINLAGESNTDEVERNPGKYGPINVGLPEELAATVDGVRLIQVSSQAVFSGGCRRGYHPFSLRNPVNSYGEQKVLAEDVVLRRSNSVVIRPTFVLGIRPDPNIGRQNPVEAMLSGQRKQVSDRYFSVSFAPDVAAVIWSTVLTNNPRRIIHAGIPFRKSRYQIARDLGLDVEPVSHDDFPGLAPRPLDTTYSEGEHRMGYAEGLKDCLARWEARQAVAA